LRAPPSSGQAPGPANAAVSYPQGHARPTRRARKISLLGKAMSTCWANSG